MTHERIIPVSKTPSQTRLHDGTSIIAQIVEDIRPNPSNTAYHEAAHVVAAGEIVEATIVPHGDALGSARPVRMTAVSAAAAGALGYGGTGWDQFITERVLRVDWGAAKAAARAELAGKEHLMHEVATILEEEGTINQHHVNKARNRVNERNQGIHKVRVDIFHPDRKVESITTKSFHSEVVISTPQSFQ